MPIAASDGKGQSHDKGAFGGGKVGRGSVRRALARASHHDGRPTLYLFYFFGTQSAHNAWRRRSTQMRDY